MPELQLAPLPFEPLVLSLCRHSRAVLRRVRHGVEHIFDTGVLPWLQPPVALDLVSSMWPVVVTQRLVRGEKRAPLAARLGGHSATRPHPFIDERVPIRDTDASLTRQQNPRSTLSN